MENKRLLLALTLSFLFLMVYQIVFQKYFTPAPTPTPATTTQPTRPPETVAAPTSGPAHPHQPPAAESPELARPHEETAAVVVEADEHTSTPLGSTDPTSDFLLEVLLSNRGAGLQEIRLNRYYQDVTDKMLAEGRHVPAGIDHQKPRLYPLLTPLETDRGPVCSLATEQIRIDRPDGQEPLVVPLADKLWHRRVTADADGPVVEFTIAVELDGKPALELIKRFHVKPHSYQILVEQQVRNLSQAPLGYQWVNFGPMGLRQEGSRSDARRMLVAKRDKKISLDKPVARKDVLKKLHGGESFTLADVKDEHKTVWIALENKYFVSIFYPQQQSSKSSPQENSPWVASVKARVFRPEDQHANGDLTFSYTSTYVTGLDRLGPDKSSSVKVVELYAGPRDQDAFRSDPRFADREYQLVTRIQGCACTFSWLTELVAWLLARFHSGIGFTLVTFFGLWLGSLIVLAGLFYDTLLYPESQARQMASGAAMAVGSLALAIILCNGTHNYGLAIMVLVAMVRVLLHPITKRGQIAMQKQAKVMAKLKPKMDVLKEKYGSGQEYQRRLLELQKQEGISPYGQMLGCLPMGLQMPIWVAIYQGIGYSIALRHQPFFGWIADLSSPDGVPWMQFGHGVSLPLLSLMLGPLTSFNILPIFVAVVMLVNQRFMPKTAPAAGDQGKQQQFIMYFMTAFFGLLFYNMPSGLNLYILSSTGVGIIEQWRIRKHVAKEEREPPPAPVPAPAPRRRTKPAKRKRR